MNIKLFFFISAMLILFIFSCEGDVSSVSQDPYGPVEDAAVSFGVKWPEAPQQEAITRTMAASATNIQNECDARGVDKVRVEVKSGAGGSLKSATFDCAAGQGSLAGIEPQSGCAVVVSGLNDSGTAIYQGQKTGVTLHAGMNNVGTIILASIDIDVLRHGGKLFAVTANTYPDTSNWDQAVRDELGPEWKVAEWNDLKQIFGNSSSGSRLLAEFIDKAYPGSNGGNVYVTRNGSRQYSSNRYYFASAHYQDLPGNYLAHDNIYNYMVSLGSWWGTSKILAMRDEDGGSNDTITKSLGMTFNYIEPGTFMMGSPLDEPGRSSNETQHQVTLTQGFHMQTTPVTQGQWEAVMGSNPSWFFNCGADCPVEDVSWNDVQAFITALNTLEGTTRYALPTEAQWEYAARAGSTTAFANGQITETGSGYDPVLDSMGWYTYNSGGRTHTVAQKAPNSLGLYDMHGNVWEWVADWYGTYPNSAVTDPTGPSSGTYRVLRGGGWYDFARYCRSAYRSYDYPGGWFTYYGFRLVLLPGY